MINELEVDAKSFAIDNPILKICISGNGSPRYLLEIFKRRYIQTWNGRLVDGFIGTRPLKF